MDRENIINAASFLPNFQSKDKKMNSLLVNKIYLICIGDVIYCVVKNKLNIT